MGVIGFELDQCFYIFSAHVLVVQLLEILHEDVEYLHPLSGFQYTTCNFMTFYWITDVGNNVVRKVRFSVFLTFRNLLRSLCTARLGLNNFGFFFFVGSSLKYRILLE